MRHSAKESGHSLEFNGPLQTREHSLLVIRRKRGLWIDSAVDTDFTPLCCTITCMHLRCTEKAYSRSLEFCLGGFSNNKPQLVLRSSVPPPECVLSVTCLSRVLSLCNFTHNIWRPMWGLILCCSNIVPKYEIGKSF